MSRRARSRQADLPDDVVPISTGTARLLRDRDRPELVTLLVNGVPSSALDLHDPTWLDFEYMQQMASLVDGLGPGPLTAVHLGAAGCALPRWLDATRPGSRQLAVDVDAELVRLVRTWFDLPRSPALRVRQQDARAAVEGLPDASADLVVRDVFAQDRTPAGLTTEEFLEQVARVLRPGGLYLANCADRPPLRLARAEAATAAAVLGEVALVAEPALLKGRRYGNLVLAAVRHDERGTGSSEPLLSSAATARRLRSLPVPARVLQGAELAAFASGAPVLRDGSTG